jgi:hypothetical protein
MRTGMELVRPITRQQLEEYDPEIPLLDEMFDDAIVDVAYQGGNHAVLYSADRCIEAILKKHPKWCYPEARDYFEHEIAEAYLGICTPMFLYRDLNAGYLE